MVNQQVNQWRKHCSPNVPEYYEVMRKTTHVIFWSYS
jgi:hypothetical protein